MMGLKLNHVSKRGPRWQRPSMSIRYLINVGPMIFAIWEYVERGEHGGGLDYYIGMVI